MNRALLVTAAVLALSCSQPAPAKPAAKEPSTPATTASTTPVAESKAAEPAKKAGGYRVVSIDCKIIEENSSWSKFSWRLVIRNDDDAESTFNAKIQFLDADGFSLDEGRGWSLRVPASSERSFTGYELIDAPIAPRVAKVDAIVTKTS